MDADESDCERLLAEGRPEAVAAILRRHQRPLLSFLRHALGDMAEAEDVLQETLLKVWEKRAGYEPRGRFSAWLFTVARRAAVDRLRARGRWAPLDAEGLPEPAAPEAERPERAAAAALTRRRVEDALAALPEAQREVFLMREYGGLTFAEIAAAVEAPLGTVLARMRYAVLKLRRELGEQDA